MKKALCLILTIGFVAVEAQTLRMLNVFKHNGSIDTTQLSVLDSATFENSHTNLKLHLNNGLTKTIPLNQIDSMQCPWKDGPVYDMQQPSAGQIFHVGDSVTVTWNFNPAPSGGKAEFHISTDGGKSWKWLTNLACYMMFKSPSMAGSPCGLGINYTSWPYVVTNGQYQGKWKFKIENPMNMPDAMADKFNPISDSVIVRLEDYDNHWIYGNTPMFKIKP